MFKNLTSLHASLAWIVYRRIVVESGYFDAEWYRLAYPDVERTKVNPLSHFLRYGRKYCLSPSRTFSTAYYLSRYEEARTSQLNPLVHYLKYGCKNGFEIQAAPPSAADRIMSSNLFDAEWYLTQYPDVASAGYSALRHYMAHGALEGRSPGPDFDATWYLTRYPDITGMNPLLHFIDHGRSEGRLSQRADNIIQLTSSFMQCIKELDPELPGTDYFNNPDAIQIIDGRVRNRVARCFEAIVETISVTPQSIVFLPWLVHGGADLVASHAVRALAQTHGEASVLVVLTDHDRMEARHLLPTGVPLLCFSTIDIDLSQSERVELVDLLVRSIRPISVLNVNSHACWEATKRSGRLLRQFTRLYGMLFCPDFAPAGHRSGYSDLYLRHCLPHMSGIYFDNQRYIDEIADQFAVPNDLRKRLVVLPQPAPQMSRKTRELSQEAPLRVLWAGRLASQKNVNLLIRIAETASEFEFHIWGRGSSELESRLRKLSSRLDHVHFHGAYDNFGALPLERYDAFLYTSLWDGLPNVLLEAASANLPIVASEVGGIGELVDDRTGWLIADLDEPAPYIHALKSIAAQPQEVTKRLKSMRDRLYLRHNWQAYFDILGSKPNDTKGLTDSR